MHELVPLLDDAPLLNVLTVVFRMLHELPLLLIWQLLDMRRNALPSLSAPTARPPARKESPRPLGASTKYVHKMLGFFGTHSPCPRIQATSRSPSFVLCLLISRLPSPSVWRTYFMEAPYAFSHTHSLVRTSRHCRRRSAPTNHENWSNCSS